MNLEEKLIGDIVAEDFRTAAIFKKHKIDFCCKGGRTIEQATENKPVTAEQIYHEIQNLPQGNNADTDFNAFPLDLLTDYIEKMHHRYVEEKTPVIQAFLEKLCRVHGERHPELFQIRDEFNASAQDLASHLKKEELVLFPFIRNMVKAQRTGQPLENPHFGTVQNPVNMMKEEHSIEGERLRRIAELSSEYTPPADACNTYRVAFAMLQDFENDLHRHIHLENNILFPKAIALEQTFSA